MTIAAATLLPPRRPRATMQDQYDYIGWWLYEAPDAGYTVWWDDEDGKEIRVDLTEPGALYDYLVEYAAPEGVQEDEL